MRYELPAVSVLAALLAFIPDHRAEAAEGGVSDYILGSRGPGAGITPPPGVYFDNTTWYYDGKIGGNRTLPLGGLLVANVSAQTWLNISTPLWVTPVNLLGGNLAFSASIPVGEPRIGAGLLVDSPRFGPIGRQVTDANTNLSDIFVQSFVGWNAGNLHWQLGVGGVIPPAHTYQDNCPTCRSIALRSICSEQLHGSIRRSASICRPPQGLCSIKPIRRRTTNRATNSILNGRPQSI